MTLRRTVAAARSLEELEACIRMALCTQDRLDPKQTPLRAFPLHRKGRLCGLLFVAYGPRRMRCQAIWICDEHRILCYDSSGTRFAEIHLYESPEYPAALVSDGQSERRRSA